MHPLSIFNYPFTQLLLIPTLLVAFLLADIKAHAQDKTTYRTDTLHLSISGTYLLLSMGAGVEFPFKQSSVGFITSYTYLFNLNQYYYLEYKHYSSRSGPGKHFYYGGHVAYNFTEHNGSELWGEEVEWEGQWYHSRSILAGPLCGFRIYNDHELYCVIFFGLNVGYRWGTRRWDHFDPDNHEYLFRRYEEDAGFKYGVRIGVSLGLQFYRQGFFKRKVGSNNNIICHKDL